MPRLLQFQFEDVLLFTSGFHVPPLSLRRRRLDRHRLDGAQKLSDQRGVDAQAAKVKRQGSQHLRFGPSHR